MTLFFLGAVIVIAFLAVARLKGAGPAQESREGRQTTVPERLPVQTKRYFFSKSENAFFGALAAALRGTRYTDSEKFVRISRTFSSGASRKKIRIP